MDMSTTTSSMFNTLNKTETLTTKSYLQHKNNNNNNNKRATPKLQNRQPQDDLSSLGLQQPETNPAVQIQDEQINDTSAKFQLNKRRSNSQIHQTLKTTLMKNYDDQLH